MAWTKVVVQKSLYHGFPQLCASCLAMDDLQPVMVTSRTSGLFQEPIHYEAPICSKCAARYRKLKLLGWPIRLAFVCAGVWVARFAFDTWVLRWLLPAGVLMLGDWFVSSFTLKDGPVRVYRKGKQGTITFWIRNEQYAQEFAAMNSAMYEPVLFGPVL
jgi:hypothetical protein